MNFVSERKLLLNLLKSNAFTCAVFLCCGVHIQHTHITVVKEYHMNSEMEWEYYPNTHSHTYPHTHTHKHSPKSSKPNECGSCSQKSLKRFHLPSIQRFCFASRLPCIAIRDMNCCEFKTLNYYYFVWFRFF